MASSNETARSNIDSIDTIDNSTTSLPSPSPEQQEIINYFEQGYNVTVKAAAGSGKTTTLLHLCKVSLRKFQSNTLILTYNTALKCEIQQKMLSNCSDIDTSKIHVYTFHGYASKLYQTSIHTDVLLRSYTNMTISSELLSIIPPVILIDEVQDMNPDYYQFVKKLLAHGKILVLVGDQRQCINEYAGADTTYLMEYEKWFPQTNRPWKELYLNTSYRCTPYIANFLNNHVIGEDLIIPGNTNSKNILPIYKYGEYGLKTIVDRMVKKYGADEVAILAASVKNINPRSPLGKLLTSKSSMLIAVSDENKIPETMKGKVTISTFNSFKGREKNCVIVTGFDESYFDFYNKQWPLAHHYLPNVIYVACSRAREQLILVQGHSKKPFRTINHDTLRMDCNIDGQQHEIEVSKSSATQTFNIESLTTHRNLDDTCTMLSYINCEIIEPEGETYKTQDIITFSCSKKNNSKRTIDQNQNGEYSEDVKIFYAKIIPIYAQKLKNMASKWVQKNTDYSLSGKLPKNSSDDDEIEYFSTKVVAFQDICHRLNTLFNIKNQNIQNLMEIVVLNYALINRLHFYLEQITHYDWVDEQYIKLCTQRLMSVLPMGRYEYAINVKGVYNGMPYELEGIADYVSVKELWMFKCAPSLNDEHKILCASYVALNYLKTGILKDGKLLNITTGEIIKINVTNPQALIDTLIKKKMHC